MKKLIFMFMAMLTVIVSAVVAITAVPVNAQTQGKAIPAATYNFIKIGQGESLESIAREYNNGTFFDTYGYIEEIKRINNLHSDRIHAGCYLTIVRYK